MLYTFRHSVNFNAHLGILSDYLLLTSLCGYEFEPGMKSTIVRFNVNPSGEVIKCGDCKTALCR
jgi:hypothetical protein